MLGVRPKLAGSRDVSSPVIVHHTFSISDYWLVRFLHVKNRIDFTRALTKQIRRQRYNYHSFCS